MKNADKLETKHGTIHALWGKPLQKPIEYSYIWEHSDDVKENHKRATKARAKVIQAIISHLD